MGDTSRQPLSAAERKRLQRARDVSRGYVEIVVRVPEDRVAEARQYCAQLTPMRRPTTQGQADLFKPGG
jgi:hypothetical protein